MEPNLTTSEQIELAATAVTAYIRRAADHEYPLDEDQGPADILAMLVAGLHHHADDRGIDFEAVESSAADVYRSQRASEPFPYRIGQEIHLRQPRAIPWPSRGIVERVSPTLDRAPAYHVRFPGQAETFPLSGLDIEPASLFPFVTTSQGTVRSLGEAERILVETAARIRASDHRGLAPHSRDVADRDALVQALSAACELDAGGLLERLEPQITAWTDVITDHWRPVRITPANELAALDFPQAADAGIDVRSLPDAEARPITPWNVHRTAPGRAPAPPRPGR